jgi:LmbE family N-acetylglucosaminyl deacetylase/predicted ATP-grasp superfamily ATP-dependent carboligase
VAVVVGMSGSTGLAVVRALAPQGVTCHAVHYDGATAAMATRLARPHVSPDWRSEPDAFVEYLVGLAGRIGVQDEAAGDAAGAAASPAASLFVCHDAALDPVWAGAERLRAAGLRPAFSARRPLAELLDKRTQMEAAARAGVSTPWTRWGAATELAGEAGECPYPAILKPAFSHLGVRALGAKALRCAGPDQLRAALRQVGEVEVLLQEYVPGGDDRLYTAGVFVSEAGHVAFTGRKLKQHPPGLGIARLAEAVDEPGLVPGSVALLHELGYQGVSQVEYKRDERDGTYRLMEANFRPWTWLGLATACGVNLPLAAHRWALADPDPAVRSAGETRPPGEARPPATSVTTGRWVWLVPEVLYTARDLRRGVRPRASQWRGLRAEAFFSRGDPGPLLRVLTAGVRTRFSRTRAQRVRRAVRTMLLGPACVSNAAVLWAEWRRAGRRSVAGARPVIALPEPGAALVLAPHPDDETLMCGATLAALRHRGDEVRVVAVTAGTATKVALTADGAPASPDEIGDVRAAELRAACAALGVDDVALWDFTDGDVGAERARLATRIAEELDALQPDFVYVPLPYDAHADHVAVALALADALYAGAGRSGETSTSASTPAIMCAAVRMPFSPDWPTRLVPAGATWEERQAALAAYASRAPALFATPTQLARLHPARLLRATEGLVEASASGYVEFARAMEDEGLTGPAMRGGGHPLSMGPKLLRTRGQRDRVAALLRRAVAAR